MTPIIFTQLPDHFFCIKGCTRYSLNHIWKLFSVSSLLFSAFLWLLFVFLILLRREILVERQIDSEWSISGHLLVGTHTMNTHAHTHASTLCTDRDVRLWLINLLLELKTREDNLHCETLFDLGPCVLMHHREKRENLCSFLCVSFSASVCLLSHSYYVLKRQRLGTN